MTVAQNGGKNNRKIIKDGSAFFLSEFQTGIFFVIKG